MFKWIFFLCFSICWKNAVSQNLIRNPSLEEIKAKNEICEYEPDSVFDRLQLKYWSSCTYFTPRKIIHSEEHSYYKNNPTARTGNIMVRLSTYTYPSYLQNQLKIPLQKGKKYYFELWTASGYPQNKQDKKFDSLQITLSDTLLSVKTYESINMKPAATLCIESNFHNKDKWRRAYAYFTAERDAKFLIIGTFRDLSAIRHTFNPPAGGVFEIDDVLLQEVREDESILALDTVFYEHSFKSAQYSLSDSLKNFLYSLNKRISTADNFDCEVIVNGYTDNIGKTENNLKLSQKRADEVKNTLISTGLSTALITANGLGSSNPIADNSTESGRAKNRRVQIQLIFKRKN
jgi:flagellar motor protein MotB